MVARVPSLSSAAHNAWGPVVPRRGNGRVSRELDAEQPCCEGCSVAAVYREKLFTLVPISGPGARAGVPPWGGLDAALGTAESVARAVQSPDSKCHSPEGGEALKKEILYPTWRDGEGLNVKFPT